MPLNEVYDYFRNYDGASYRVVAQQGNEPTEVEVAAFESRIGFRLPDEFREFAVHPLGGLYMEVKEEIRNGYPRLVPFLKIMTNADPYCFTPDQRIVIWPHDAPDKPESISGSFSEVLMREIRALEDRKERKLRGEDKQPPNKL